MNNKRDIQNQVQATIDSLDGIVSATPGPFFFTRVQARLYKTEKNVWEKLSGFIARPAVAIAMVTVFLLMNTVAVVQQKLEVKRIPGRNPLTLPQPDQTPAPWYV